MTYKFFNQKERNKLNKELTKLTVNKYFPEIPIKLFETIFRFFEIDTEFLDGIYCGRSGRAEEKIPGTNLFWVLTWYRMESGRYEIVAYVS